MSGRVPVFLHGEGEISAQSREMDDDQMARGKMNGVDVGIEMLSRVFVITVLRPDSTASASAS